MDSVKRYKRVIISISIIALLVVGACTFIRNPIVHINNFKLKQLITSITTESVELNQIVPFEWDIVYTFKPYASKSQIEEIIGFKSHSIKENAINEGMGHLWVYYKKVLLFLLIEYLWVLVDN